MSYFIFTLKFDFLINIFVFQKNMHPWLNWIERLTTDQKVEGSNPSGCTKKAFEILKAFFVNIFLQFFITPLINGFLFFSL